MRKWGLSPEQGISRSGIPIRQSDLRDLILKKPAYAAWLVTGGAGI